MTSNMTMTAISICDFLKLIVKSTVKHYTEDFKLDIKIFKRYAKEAQETGKPVSMLWFCDGVRNSKRLLPSFRKSERTPNSFGLLRESM